MEQRGEEVKEGSVHSLRENSIPGRRGSTHPEHREPGTALPPTPSSKEARGRVGAGKAGVVGDTVRGLPPWMS